MKELLALTYIVAAMLLAPLVVALRINPDPVGLNPMAYVEGFVSATESSADDSVMAAAECDPRRTGP